MFKQMVKNMNLDKDYPERAIMIDVYTRILEGTFYDHLTYSFCNEYDIAGNYIPLTDRAPSVKDNLCRLVVDDSVSLTFGTDHFPKIVCDNAEKQNFLDEVIEDIKAQVLMIEAATTGSVGSVVCLLRILKNKLNVDIKNTQYLTPIYDPENPRELLKVREKFKVAGQELVAQGYNIKEPKKIHWFIRDWTANEEIIYQPYPVTTKNPIETIARQIQHNLAFVPVVWIKNLPKTNSIDGYCTFSQAIDTNIELDYQLSQAGRGLKYSADPSVVLQLDDSLSFAENNAQNVAASTIPLADGSIGTVTGAATQQRKVIRSASNALVVGKDDDVKMLEISGNASKAVIEYTRFLRELALESMHGNRANADKVNAAQSGKAMQAMNQALIWLADKLRISYGENGLVVLLDMICRASHKYPILIKNKTYRNIDINEKIKLIWPHWYPNTPAEKLQNAQALKVNTDSGNLSHKTATQSLADDYDIQNIDDEIAEIEAEQAKLMATQPTVTETIAA